MTKLLVEKSDVRALSNAEAMNNSQASMTVAKRIAHGLPVIDEFVVGTTTLETRLVATFPEAVEDRDLKLLSKAIGVAGKLQDTLTYGHNSPSLTIGDGQVTLTRRK